MNNNKKETQQNAQYQSLEILYQDSYEETFLINFSNSLAQNRLDQVIDILEKKGVYFLDIVKLVKGVRVQRPCELKKPTYLTCIIHDIGHERKEGVKVDFRTRVRKMMGKDRRLRTAASIKQLEICLQADIESCITDYDKPCWWQHTNRNIFMDLLSLDKNDMVSEYIEEVLIPSLF